MRGAPAPDGRHDDLDATELEGLALLVPDDARSLDADRQAYLRDLRRRAGNDLMRPSVLPQRVPPGLLVVAVVAVIALIGAGLTAFMPRASQLSALAQPIASTPAAAPGEVGGLLPDGSLDRAGQRLPLRAQRPAVLALVPPQCATCTKTLEQVLAQAQQAGVRLVLVGTPEQMTDLETLDVAWLSGGAVAAADPAGVLASAYQPSGLTLVLVHTDGVVGAVLRDVAPGQQLRPGLSGLKTPGAPRPT